MKASVYDTKGKEVRSLELPENVFGAPLNTALVHQVVVGMEGNARTNVAHTKDRSEVRGGGRKPWKQKGTGRARHGSRRSPIWKGGGITFGPRSDKEYGKNINKKMRARAFASVLSAKMKDGEVLLVDSLSFKAPKTQDAKTVLTGLANIKGFEALANRKNNAALIALGEENKEKNVIIKKSFNNMGNVLVQESRNLNPVDLLNYKYLIITNPETAIEMFVARMK